MCDECGEQCDKSPGRRGYPPRFPQARIVSAYGAEDQHNSSVATVQDTTMDMFLKSQAALHMQLVRINRQTYNKSRPVDEYQGLNSPTLQLTWLAEYALQERIESITASLPVGITTAVLQLGQRFITLYSGAATVVQTLVNLQGLGIIIGESDNRALVMTGAPTTGVFIAMAGFCLERDGDR